MSWREPTEGERRGLPGYQYNSFKVAYINEYGLELTYGLTDMDDYSSGFSISLIKDRNPKFGSLVASIPDRFVDGDDLVDLNYYLNYYKYYDNKESMFRDVKSMPSALDEMISSMKSDDEFWNIVTRFVNKFGFKLH